MFEYLRPPIERTIGWVIENETMLKTSGSEPQRSGVHDGAVHEAESSMSQLTAQGRTDPEVGTSFVAEQTLSV